MNTPRPTTLSATEIRAWRRTPSRRRVSFDEAIRSALACAFALFIVYVGIMRLIGGAW